jgi:DnaJ-like protein
MAMAGENPLQLIEDHIGEHLREAEASGELRHAPSFGRPLQFNDGYDETPPELRMAMKILHDAGVAPPEVELFHRLAALRREVAAAAGDTDRQRTLAQQASELEQRIALHLERLRGGAL